MSLTELVLYGLADEKTENITEEQIKCVWDAALLDFSIFSKHDPDGFTTYVNSTVQQSFPGCEVN